MSIIKILKFYTYPVCFIFQFFHLIDKKFGENLSLTDSEEIQKYMFSKLWLMKEKKHSTINT